MTANVTNTVGLVPGSVSGTLGYREELQGQRPRLLRLGLAAGVGAVAGAVLLLALPEATFSAVVPALILLACVLVAIQPWLARRLAGRSRRPHGGRVVWLLVLATGVYGGYFGAAQGVILTAVLGLGLDETLQRVNAAKNVLALVANAVSGAVFVIVTHIDWAAAGLVAAGAALGGVLGSRVGRRLPPVALRLLVVAIGVLAAVTLL